MVLCTQSGGYTMLMPMGPELHKTMLKDLR